MHLCKTYAQGSSDTHQDADADDDGSREGKRAHGNEGTGLFGGGDAGGYLETRPGDDDGADDNDKGDEEEEPTVAREAARLPEPATSERNENRKLRGKECRRRRTCKAGSKNKNLPPL